MTCMICIQCEMLPKEGALPIERYPEIDEVVAYIHRHLDEPLTLDRLARYAAYSPYHFTRVFKERIGLSPQYYVSALRLQKAKELLLHTNMKVRDIAMEIGQNSLGTFTTRFTERIGVTPADFRNSAHQANRHLLELRDLRNFGDPGDFRRQEPSFGVSRLPAGCGQVEGTITAEAPFEGVVLIGLFAKPIPEGIPLHGTLTRLPSPATFRFENVEPGTYYLMATSVSWSMQANDMLLPQATLRTRSRQPIVVGPCSPFHNLEVRLYPPRLDDPPILISLPLLMKRFLHRAEQAAR